MKYRQLLIDFGRSVMRRVKVLPDDLVLPSPHTRLRHDPLLEDFANQLLLAAKCKTLRVSVCWNPGLRTTAGLADWRKRRIILNPKLLEISSSEVHRTLRHELAHILAQHRVGRRRIAAHGEEWKEACADLGIPNEPRCHNLPFKRRRVERKYFYSCPECGMVLARVRPIRRKLACVKCCQKYNDGKYHERFRFRLLAKPEVLAA